MFVPHTEASVAAGITVSIATITRMPRVNAFKFFMKIGEF